MDHSHVDEDDDSPTLSADTLRALQEFRNEQQQRDNLVSAESTFEENWQLSQFWYDDVTADKLASEALRLVRIAAPSGGGKIACVSCPTVYRRLREIVGHNSDVTTSVGLSLFEYDRRFTVFGADFVFYDYRYPTADSLIPFRDSFNVVLVDPPFLSDECLTKTAETVRMIAKDKIILCTGATMQHLVEPLLHLRLCSFRPGHARNLANEFRCYANYDLDNHIIS